MNPTDAFFTQTVVGAPYTVMLGRRMNTAEIAAQGLEVNLSNGESRFSRLWQEWIVLSHDDDEPGMPRQRPSRWRRWLERHALWVAPVGLLSLLSSAAAWGVMLWR